MSFLFSSLCVFRPVSRMLLLHLAIWAFLFSFFVVHILMEYSIIKHSVSATMAHLEVSSIIFFNVLYSLRSGHEFRVVSFHLNGPSLHLIARYLVCLLVVLHFTFFIMDMTSFCMICLVRRQVLTFVGFDFVFTLEVFSVQHFIDT